MLCPSHGAGATDYVSETFQSGTEQGGYDGPHGSLRYLEWCWDPDPSDHTYLVDYAFQPCDSSGSVRVEHDRHVEGLFPLGQSGCGCCERQVSSPATLRFTTRMSTIRWISSWV